MPAKKPAVIFLTLTGQQQSSGNFQAATESQQVLKKNKV